jgi:protein-S-isoprenylcysteine O-methyltransferase Ste14
MHPLDWLAALGLAALLPIPLYWLVIHPFAAFWRRRGAAAAFWAAVPISTAIAWTCLYLLRSHLFAASHSPWWAKALGLALIGIALYIFVRVKKELGAERLLGKTELRGDGELRIAGLYQHMRHPSYAAQMATMLGLCLLSATPPMWAVAAAWVLLLNLAIRFEERELLARFGHSYRDYRARVPAFLPWPRRNTGK